ncbi:MAG: RloB family protein [Magnetospirillum sp. WYHS-4]
MLCEGKVTEPEYLRGYERLKRNVALELDIAREQGVPLTLVKAALERKKRAEREAKRTGDSFIAYDEVWCVFDVDEHPRINDAVQLAVANGICLAVSNPCFELWLLLHFRESPGPRHRDDMKRLLRDHLPGYDKHLQFDTVERGVENAVRRASRLDAEAAEVGERGRNPTSGVYNLTESIARDARLLDCRSQTARQRPNGIGDRP